MRTHLIAAAVTLGIATSTSPASATWLQFCGTGTAPSCAGQPLVEVVDNPLETNLGYSNSLPIAPSYNGTFSMALLTAGDAYLSYWSQGQSSWTTISDTYFGLSAGTYYGVSFNTVDLVDWTLIPTTVNLIGDFPDSLTSMPVNQGPNTYFGGVELISSLTMLTLLASSETCGGTSGHPGGPCIWHCNEVMATCAQDWPQSPGIPGADGAVQLVTDQYPVSGTPNHGILWALDSLGNAWSYSQDAGIWTPKSTEICGGGTFSAFQIAAFDGIGYAIQATSGTSSLVFTNREGCWQPLGNPPGLSGTWAVNVATSNLIPGYAPAPYNRDILVWASDKNGHIWYYYG